MIYLDNAATTFPKPPSVRRGVAHCMRALGGNPGRGGNPLAMRAAGCVYECRRELASFFNAPGPEEVVFTANTTAALNLAIKGVLQNGSHVLISDVEHNSVYRPLWRLDHEGMITLDVFPTFPALPPGEKRDDAICRAILQRLRPDTRLLVTAHTSNVCSATQPIGKIGEICRKHGVLFLVDAAQSAGHLPIDLEKMSIDLLCIPGHKGLYGPQGSGALLFGRRGIVLHTLVEGGNGLDSLNRDMVGESPERYEAGTLSTPAIAGLCEGVRFVRGHGVDEIGAHEGRLFDYLSSRLSEMPGTVILAPLHRGAVLSFNLVGVSADTVGQRLGEAGICVRTGYHCSALGAETLGTPPGGSVRVGFGAFNTTADCDKLLRVLKTIRE